MYVAGNVGVAMATDTEMDDPELPGVSMDVTYDTGLALSAALGYGIGNFRLEAEFAWQRNDFDSRSRPLVTAWPDFVRRRSVASAW